MKITIKKAKLTEELISLHRALFPDDDRDLRPTDTFWIARVDNKIAGMCALRDAGHNSAFITWAGVMPKYRGLGIHRKMVRIRERHAKSSGYGCIVTYVLKDNTPSFINLIRLGYELYIPEWKYAGDVHYFKRGL